MVCKRDSVIDSMWRRHPTLRVVSVIIVVILLSLITQSPIVADVDILPAPPCTEATEREYVDVNEFLQNYDTPEGHFTIWYELESQRTEDPSGTCFPVLFKVDNAQRFVENVGALLEQVYSFYAGDYATPAFPGLGFNLPPHVDIKLYNSDGSYAATSTIRLKVKHIYVDVGGEYRFRPRTIIHELMHIIQARTGAPTAPSPLLDWYYEGQARYANWYLGSRDDGTGEFLTYFGETPMHTSFWDLSETLELGSYHYGGRFWRFLTYNWPGAGISEMDRDGATHLITLPWPTSAASIYKLRPQRGIYMLQGVMTALDARVDGGSCPIGDECFREAVNSAIGAGNWARVDGNLYTYDEVYRAYGATNVDLEGPNGGHYLMKYFRGKFKSTGLVGKAVDQAVIRTYDFETFAEDDYTLLVTASADNGSQNGTGDDDDLRFELDTEAFGWWDSSDSFNGNALHGLTVSRFLRTEALPSLAPGLPAGDHTLTVFGDETPAIKQIRVVRDDIVPVLAEEWIPMTYFGSTAPRCPGDYNFHTGYEVDAPGPLMIVANSTLRPQDVHSTLFRLNTTSLWYYPFSTSNTVSYETDAPQVLKASRTGGVPVTMRTRTGTLGAPPFTFDICTKGTISTELHTIDSVYLYPIPTYDVFVEVHGHLHEYSTQYEVFIPDPQAASIEISLVGPTSGRFLNVTGEWIDGSRVLLSPDVWQPSATQPFSYTLKAPGIYYKRIIVGVGAYSFEGFDLAFEDVTQRATIPYTLRIVTHYDETPPDQFFMLLPIVAKMNSALRQVAIH